jgi:hypothetical protein
MKKNSNRKEGRRKIGERGGNERTKNENKVKGNVKNTKKEKIRLAD